MNKIIYKTVEELVIKKEADRNCFMYGICSQKNENAPECHKITQFGLDALNAEKEKFDIVIEENGAENKEQKTEGLNIKERACAVHGRCSEDPFNDLLHDLSKFGLKVVNEK